MIKPNVDIRVSNEDKFLSKLDLDNGPSSQGKPLGRLRLTDSFPKPRKDVGAPDTPELRPRSALPGA